MQISLRRVTPENYADASAHSYQPVMTLFRTRSIAAAIVLAGCMLGIAWAPVVPEPQQPNIVLIYVDDLGWKDVGFNGSLYYETPNMDQVASEGIIFTHAYANAPNCAPSRASLMTGLYTPRHGIYTVGSPARGWEEHRLMVPPPNTTDLSLSFVTLAEALQQAGYATGHFGKWHLGDTGFHPEDQGFDVNVGGYFSGSPRGGYFAPYNNPALVDGPEGEHLTERLTDEAITFITDNRDRPFFLCLAYYAVHTPIQARAELVSQYENKPPDGGQDNRTYAAMIETTDVNIGRLMRHLDALNLSHETVVIINSDNGGAIQATSNEPLRGHKGMLYEGGIRVPLAMRWPNTIAPGRIDATPIIGLDLYPTLVDITGAAPLEYNLDGVSLLPILDDSGSLAERNLYWHFPAYLEMPRAYPGIWRITPAGAIRRGHYKLIEFFEGGVVELYNLSNDPGEANNLADRMPELAATMRGNLAAWRDAVGAAMPTPK